MPKSINCCDLNSIVPANNNNHARYSNSTGSIEQKSFIRSLRFISFSDLYMSVDVSV